MNTRKNSIKAQMGYYCAIQYCPDHSRLETINVGVLLFCPKSDYLDCRLAKSNARAKKIAPLSPASSKALTGAKTAFANRIHSIAGQIKTVEDLRKFRDSRANDLMLTDPRACRVDDAKVELDRLFEDLVG